MTSEVKGNCFLRQFCAFVQENHFLFLSASNISQNFLIPGDSLHSPITKFGVLQGPLPQDFDLVALSPMILVQCYSTKLSAMLETFSMLFNMLDISQHWIHIDIVPVLVEMHCVRC